MIEERDGDHDGVPDVHQGGRDRRRRSVGSHHVHRAGPLVRTHLACDADDPTIGRLVADASRDISTLVSKEIALAKSELKVSIKAGGIGAGCSPVRRSSPCWA